MVTLYTTHCPKCKILEKKMADKNISYVECTDIDEMAKKDILSVPVLEVDGNMMDFVTANTWLNGR